MTTTERRTKHCTSRCTSTRHSSTCYDRQRRARDRDARREEPDQNVAAYRSDELNLSEEEVAGVKNILATEIKDDHGNVLSALGPASMDELLRCVKRNGRIDGIIESAWALPLWQFHKVRGAWTAAPVPGRPKIRRAA